MEIRGMDISSMVLANANTQSAIGIKLLSNALDQDQENAMDLTKMLEQSVNPGVGRNIDIRL